MHLPVTKNANINMKTTTIATMSAINPNQTLPHSLSITQIVKSALMLKISPL